MLSSAIGHGLVRSSLGRADKDSRLEALPVPGDDPEGLALGLPGFSHEVVEGLLRVQFLTSTCDKSPAGLSLTHRTTELLEPVLKYLAVLIHPQTQLAPGHTCPLHAGAPRTGRNGGRPQMRPEL